MDSSAIEGATISLLNTHVRASTDSQGNFSIINLPTGTYIVQVSCIGFAGISRVITIENQVEKVLVFKLTETSGQLEEVIVTAQKAEELLQKVPVSLTAILNKQIQEYRLWTMRDLTGIVPNLFSSNSGDDRNVSSIRGITSTSYDPAVAVYIDGVNQFSLDTYISQLVDIDRVEVLRGPQGTLYGRNALGGVINIITRQQGYRTQGFTEITAGNYGQKRYSGGLSNAILKDKVLFGVSGVFNKRTGFYKNEFNDLPFDNRHSYTGNYFIKYSFNRKWNLHLNIKHLNTRNNGAFPLVIGVSEAFTKPYSLSQNAVAKMIDNTFNASFIVNYKAAKFNFKSQTAYQSNYRYYDKPLDGD
ncbi:MAG: TonB-dependent receptor, partial [Calditrichaeota bacterium]|nr:TonB-dependent receptor [Calditrichota bacterium]